MLVVPPKFNRNSPNVSSLMTPEQSGIWLLERMRQQLGFESYADKKVLDFGCGVRFSQAIINTEYPFGRYFGVDTFQAMIKFLKKNVHDPRFGYYCLDARHPSYNPRGRALSPHSILEIDEHDFDIACMFSVITHQYPNDAKNIFWMLRRYVRTDGYLFFTCFLDRSISEFEDRSPRQDGGRCFYNPDYLTNLVESCGWRQVSCVPAEAPLIGDSFVYQRAEGGVQPEMTSNGGFKERSLVTLLRQLLRSLRSYLRMK